VWSKNWRAEIWSQLGQPWDILVIGGGITGAGILREASRLGLRALLLEKRDYAWGTSSRSSKLVHGGLRYLKEGKILLTRSSVQEREQLLEEGPGLIDPLGFLLTVNKGDSPGRWMYKLGLSVYDLLALQWDHEYYDPEEFRLLAPHIAHHNLTGGFRYGDAQTDDARLVLRVIQESVAEGGVALNYVSAQQLLRDEAGVVTGVQVRDEISGEQANLHARVVINATGAWADQLRGQLGMPPRIRPLRGSHLIFSSWRLPVAQAVSFLHPLDRRPVFIFPWEGVTLVGTTDVDHHQPLDQEPGISPHEVAYLMAAVEAQFPSLGIRLEDVVSTFAGVRPVIGSGKVDPSKESRDHIVWEDQGLLTVTGGKLTTFRLIALDVLKAARPWLPEMPELDSHIPVLDRVEMELPEADHLDPALTRRLLGRYGKDAANLVLGAGSNELEVVPDTQVLWAELRWAARAEAVVHLDDLMLRRVRLGLILPQGGMHLLPRIRAVCQEELGWDDARWMQEAARYGEIWRKCYNLPASVDIPDWRRMLREARSQPPAINLARRSNRWLGAAALMGAAMAGIGLLSWWFFRRYQRGVGAG
jgi:glycerol-3-phosphate dehydrogenase